MADSQCRHSSGLEVGRVLVMAGQCPRCFEALIPLHRNMRRSGPGRDLCAPVQTV